MRVEDRSVLKLKEISSEYKIVEERNFLGYLKVFLSWYLIWNTIYGLGFSIILGILCHLTSGCPNESMPFLRMLKTISALGASYTHMSMRMSNKAKRRYAEKYQEHKTE